MNKFIATIFVICILGEFTSAICATGPNFDSCRKAEADAETARSKANDDAAAARAKYNEMKPISHESTHIPDSANFKTGTSAHDWDSMQKMSRQGRHP